MPLVQPSAGRTLNVERRLRQLLTSHPPLQNLFTLPIRGVTPEAVEDLDGVAVAIYTADEDYEPETTCSVRTSPRFILTVTVPEGSGLSTAQIEELRERNVSITTLVRDAVWHFRQDPTPGDSLWWGIKFKKNPTTIYNRAAQKCIESTTHFDVLTQKANP